MRSHKAAFAETDRGYGRAISAGAQPLEALSMGEEGPKTGSSTSTLPTRVNFQV